MAQRKDGRSRHIAVILRLADSESVAAIPMAHFDGLVSFDDLGRDGGYVRYVVSAQPRRHLCRPI